MPYSAFYIQITLLWYRLFSVSLVWVIFFYMLLTVYGEFSGWLYASESVGCLTAVFTGVSRLSLLDDQLSDIVGVAHLIARPTVHLLILLEPEIKILKKSAKNSQTILNNFIKY